MLNIHAVLVKLFEPVMDIQFSKVGAPWAELC